MVCLPGVQWSSWGSPIFSFWPDVAVQACGPVAIVAAVGVVVVDHWMGASSFSHPLCFVVVVAAAVAVAELVAVVAAAAVAATVADLYLKRSK